MPLVDVFALIPPSHKYLKDAVTERIKEAQGMVPLSHECSAITQKKIVIQEKLGDPGSFTLPCTLGPMSFENCLCDLGASVSLMPLAVAKQLGLNKYKPSNISLILADRSIRLPHGLLKDLPIRIGNVILPTDFIVLEMDEEPRDPLILGRPFLATAGALIDVRNGKIDLDLGENLRMRFDIKDTMKKPMIDGQIFWIEEMDQLANELLQELAEEEKSEAGYLHNLWDENDGHDTASLREKTDSEIGYKGELEEEKFSLKEETPEEDKDEEKSAEEIVKEFEILLGCTIGEDLLIRYEEEEDQEEDDQNTIKRHLTDIFKEIKEQDPPMPQLFSKHRVPFSNTPPFYHGLGKTIFEKLQLKVIRGWLYDALRNIPYEEIRMNTFRGWFYDEYDPGDPSSPLRST